MYGARQTDSCEQSIHMHLEKDAWVENFQITQARCLSMDGLQMDTVTVASMAGIWMVRLSSQGGHSWMDKPGKTIGNNVSDA